MTRRKTLLTRLSLLTLLAVFVYQGFVATARAEVNFELSSLKRDGFPTSPKDLQTSTNLKSNAAPLYLAAIAINSPNSPVNRRNAKLQDLVKEHELVSKLLKERCLTFSLLEQAAARKECDFGFDYSENQGSQHLDLLGARSLVRLSCLEILQRAERGDHEGANHLASQTCLFVKRLNETPTAIGHSVSISLSKQLLEARELLQRNKPEANYSLFSLELQNLADHLDQNLPLLAQNERVFSIRDFERMIDGSTATENLVSESLAYATRYKLLREELACLRALRRVDEALKSGDTAALKTFSKEDKSTLVEAYSSYFYQLSLRHGEVVAALKKA